MGFFDKTRVDADKKSEIECDLDDLVCSVDSFKDEIDTYKDELEAAKSDLEDADTADAFKEVLKKLREISVPDGCENMDSTPDGIADELEEAMTSASDFDAWREDIGEKIQSVQAAINSTARGITLPSQKVSPFAIFNESAASGRIVRPNEPATKEKNLPFSSETDAWAKGLRELCAKAALVRYKPEEEATRESVCGALFQKFMDVVMEIMAYRHDSGTIIEPKDQPHLALMWFVDDLLHNVARAKGDCQPNTRLVVTTVDALLNVRRRLDEVQSLHESGCEKIEESAPVE